MILPTGSHEPSWSVATALLLGLGADPVVVDHPVSDRGPRGIYVYQYARPVIDGCDGTGVSTWMRGAGFSLERS